MVVKVKKRKAGSYRDLTYEEYQIDKVETLEKLLEEVLKIELRKAKENEKLYESTVYSFEKAVNIMKQDYIDGLFRVFFNQKECKHLEEKIDWQEENELVFIKLVMLAGRLW